MKIILDKDDIIELIKESYNGVEKVELVDIEVTVTANSAGFKKKVVEETQVISEPTKSLIEASKRTTLSSPVNTGPVEQIKPLTEEEKAIMEKKQGVMGSGGRRVIGARF